MVVAASSSASAGLRLSVRRSGPISLVAVDGTLAQGSYSRLRDSLLMVVADEPVGLVVDTEHLWIAPPHLASVFDLVASRAALWPDIPVVVLAPPGSVSRAALMTLECRALLLRTSLADAVRAADAKRTRRRAVARLGRDVHAAATARRLVREATSRWGVPSLAPAAAVIVTELVENVMLHTNGDAHLRLSLRGGALSVAVGDGERSVPVPRLSAADAAQPGGMGLRIVASTATAWGHMPSFRGKVVWATVR